MNAPHSTVDAAEVARFAAMADEWWDAKGKFRPLHRLNPVRIAYIRDTLRVHFNKADLNGLNIIDIGCGGGLLSEPLSRLGANVTGLDASEKNVRIASLHAEQTGAVVNYKASTAEDEAATGAQYDAVLAMEIIEHVADVPLFLSACSQLVKPGGLLLVATLNRTVKSFLSAIVGAEYVLRWLPVGTHTWEKFLNPSEIDAVLRGLQMETQEVTGVSYHPLSDSFSLSKDLSVNYMLLARKPAV